MIESENGFHDLRLLVGGRNGRPPAIHATPRPGQVPDTPEPASGNLKVELEELAGHILIYARGRGSGAFSCLALIELDVPTLVESRQD